MPPDLTVHALLRIAGGVVIDDAGAPPAWASAALARAPWVVVRRAPESDGLIPVGVRGRSRAERAAAWLDPRRVLECVTPVQLAARRGWEQCPAPVPALAALAQVSELMRARSLSWGPCGSVGFELASGVATATADSDLDLVVHAPERMPAATAAALLQELAELAVRVDVQLETPHGGVALAEWAAAPDSLLLRSADGPRRVADPWMPLPAAA